MGELFANFGDLVFTLVIGYISTIEFLYVARHLLHYSFNHDTHEYDNDVDNLSQLQDSMRKQLANAKSKEALAGTQVMKDGVPYKDGFRLDAQQATIDQLKEQLKNKELTDLKRQELEKELAKQTKIAQQLRKELEEAEAKYERQLKQEEAEKARKDLAEQQKREKEEQAKREAEENARKQKEQEEQQEKARKLAEQEKQKEAEQRQREEEEERIRQEEQKRKQQEEAAEAEENTRRLAEIERANEEKLAAEENERRIFESERQKEEQEKFLEIEHRLEEQLRTVEQEEAALTDKERQLIESIKKRDLPDNEEGNEQREDELLRRILEAREQFSEESEEEQSFRLMQKERDQEAKQKRIEENALLFLEAEKEMADLQAQMMDAVEKREFHSNLESAPQTPIIEEPCLKRTLAPLLGEDLAVTPVSHTVKTQLAQDMNESYSVSTKPLLFPGVSDDTSSIDPASSQQSSFSTQPSEEITTGTDSQYPQHERQDPDGEDTAPSQQYTDDYLRSLDGIKQRPLIREDGSGRRRAFKKRRSSNSSNSSRESRHSRDEELKMFTSLEEEEMKDSADTDFTPIRYTSEPTLKVKGHHRRHKRSPAKDMKHEDDGSRSSLERLSEEANNPWGEVKPEPYKNTEFWKREKTLSIDEETEFEKPASSEEIAYDTATNMPSASSFEEATQIQNEEALTALRKQANKDATEGASDDQAAAKEEPARSDNTNLQISQTEEKEASPARSSASPRLRRSPRMEVIDQYEERWKETNETAAPTSSVNTPTITVQTPLDFAPWRDEHGLIMEGLSDFYDFQASVNPSRSRPSSRNPSPANTAPNTPLPKDVSFDLEFSNTEESTESTVEIYDDTEDFESREFKKENIIKFIDSLNGNEPSQEEKELNDCLATESHLQRNIQYVADDPCREKADQASLVPLVNIIDDIATTSVTETDSGDDNMNALVSSLRTQQTARSRSKSPLPTAGNLQRSLENRRNKMIKHNEDVLEKLIESKLLPDLSFLEDTEDTTSPQVMADNDDCSKDQMDSLVQSLRVDRSRSRSKSPMRLPTNENLSKSVESRRHKLIERNDEMFKQLEERSLTPDSPTITVEYVYEYQTSEETNIESTLDQVSFNTPAISIECPETEQLEHASKEEEDDCSREKMDLLVQSLRVARSRSRSKSPMRLPNAANNLNESKESTDSPSQSEILNAPTISIELAEPSQNIPSNDDDDDGCSQEKMDLLVQSLRVARSRSRSKSPMRLPTVDNLNKSLNSRRSKLIERNDELLQHMEERAKTPEPPRLTVEYVYEFENSTEEGNEEARSRYSRSKSPSRSHTPSTEREDYNDFHVMLNLEGSQNKTLSISSEEQETLNLANRQRQLDVEALEKLKNASEEIKLRTLSPLVIDTDEFNEQQSQDYLADLPITERAKLLRKSPTTPDYERTISEEMRDVERIKQERLDKGFKRSTYVGESMDLGSEFEPLRREAARFQRSRSPSPSFSKIDSEVAPKTAEEKRKIQDMILQELTTSSSSEGSKEQRNTGAIPKTDRMNSCEIELSLTNEIEDTLRIKEEMLNIDFQRSTYALDNSVDKTQEYEELRRRNAAFRRSASTSRSPLRESQREQLAEIETEAIKRELQDKALDEMASASMNFQDFSRHLNPNFFDNDRRASDSALIKKPEIYEQLQDNDYNMEMEPEEYHHYRRFSLAQEQPTEEYPSEDYIFIEQVEVRTRSGSRTWTREDFYSEDVHDFFAKKEKSPGANTSSASEDLSDAEQNNMLASDNESEENLQAGEDDEEYSNGSDDDRQTVVEVDDEIDEDIFDFNERGPAEESHHETSECEEAEREMDRYAGREASDWNRVQDVFNNEISHNDNTTSEEDEGAVGGLSNSPYDSDSFAIDQIYDEAIKNRKQSGILREYDSILMQMSSSDIDEQYLLWSKTQSKTKTKNIEFNNNFIDSTLQDTEIRYLGDANVAARQSLRLRSRYGYNPVLQAKSMPDDIEVDLNYKPKREYNWRKNFKLEDDEKAHEDKEISLADVDFAQNDVKEEREWEEDNWQQTDSMLDMRKYSLGGESVILFSRSPEETIKEEEECNVDETNNNNNKEVLVQESVVVVCEEKPEKLKKKKTKKKVRKESKGSLEETMNKEDEDAYDSQVYSRRSSSIQMDTDSPKRKSRSRRSSKSSVTNEDSMGLFSPRTSVSFNEPINDIMEEYTDMAKDTARPKKMKKRKKVKETMSNVAESPIENKEELLYNAELLNNIAPVSTIITPESFNVNILSSLSSQNSVCVTPASIDMDVNVTAEDLRERPKDTTAQASTSSNSPSASISRTSSITTPVDTFDILKDANFYPLF